MGNSEVGHLNLGAGAVVRQDLTRIDDAIADGSFARNEALLRACEVARERGRLHLLGLVSAGGVHASMDHLRALIELARAQGVPDVVVHAFTDGRDTSPNSGAGYVAEVEGWGGARIATVERALLRDGPRPPLGAHAARVRRDRRGQGRAPRRDGRGCGSRRLRARRDRRVHRADAGRGGGPRAGGRRGRVLQLPPRPRAPALREARPARRPDDAHRVQRALGLPDRVPARAPGGHARVLPGGPRHLAAARRRDGEVRARHLLLQRRRGGSVRGRGARRSSTHRGTCPPTTRSRR